MSTPHIYALEGRDFIEPVAVASATAAAGRGPDNVLSWMRPNRLFVGTGAWGSEHLTFDFGATQTLQGIYVDNINTPFVVVSGHATDSWGSPSYSDSFGTVDLPAWGRTKVYVNLRSTTWESTGYRYLRLTTGAFAPFGGDTVWKVGGVLPHDSAEASGNFGWPLQLEVIEPSISQERFGSTPEVSILGDKRFGLTLTQPVQDEGFDEFAQEILGQGVGRHLVFYRNNGNPREAWLMRRVSRNGYSYDGPRTRSLQNVVFEEVA